jgi:hypothetical protein
LFYMGGLTSITILSIHITVARLLCMYRLPVFRPIARQMDGAISGQFCP